MILLCHILVTRSAGSNRLKLKCIIYWPQNWFCLSLPVALPCQIVRFSRISPSFSSPPPLPPLPLSHQSRFFLEAQEADLTLLYTLSPITIVMAVDKMFKRTKRRQNHNFIPRFVKLFYYTFSMHDQWPTI